MSQPARCKNCARWWRMPTCYNRPQASRRSPSNVCYVQQYSALFNSICRWTGWRSHSILFLVKPSNMLLDSTDFWESRSLITLPLQPSSLKEMATQDLATLRSSSLSNSVQVKAAWASSSWVFTTSSLRNLAMRSPWRSRQSISRIW